MDKEGKEVLLVNEELNVYEQYHKILLEMSWPHNVYDDEEHESHMVEVYLIDSSKEYHNKDCFIQVVQYEK
jgi:hypothetical protein